jgi:3-oxoadipate enol-lactonase
LPFLQPAACSPLSAARRQLSAVRYPPLMLLPLSSSSHLSFHTEGTGTPIVFLHAFPFTHLMYAHTVANLPPSCRAILPDLRGFGQSSIFPELSIETFAADTLRILDELNIKEPAIFVGTSIGGMIAMELWRKAPTRVRGLVIANSRANPESAEGRQRRETLAQLALAKGSAAYVDAVSSQLFSDKLDQAQRDFWIALMVAQSPVSIAATARALANRPDSTPTLPTITCPTLIIGTELDTISPPDVMRDIHAKIALRNPRASLVIIPGAGHIPSIEAPIAFSNLVNDYVSSITAV